LAHHRSEMVILRIQSFDVLSELFKLAVQFIDPRQALAQQDFEPAGIVLFISELLAQAD
jgi:hypothetical protein